MTPLMVTIKCEPCGGTGSIESSDSTDDRWWDCPHCGGTGKRTIPDRRAPAERARIEQQLENDQVHQMRKTGFCPVCGAEDPS
jgi:hypothetical protein